MGTIGVSVLGVFDHVYGRLVTRLEVPLRLPQLSRVVAGDGLDDLGGLVGVVVEHLAPRHGGGPPWIGEAGGRQCVGVEPAPVGQPFGRVLCFDPELIGERLRGVLMVDWWRPNQVERDGALSCATSTTITTRRAATPATIGHRMKGGGV